MLVSIAPIAFLVVGERGEHGLFIVWRWLQVGTLFAAGGYVLYQLARGRRSDFVVLALLAAGVGFIALSYSGIAWDAQIEYHRVLLLADHYGSLTNGYRHGLTNWILGYPP